MKRLILPTLMLIFVSYSCGKDCDIINDGDYFRLICESEDTKKPNHIINGESVGCESKTVEALRENIKTIDIKGCSFDDFDLFKNFTKLRFAFFDETKSIRKEVFVGMNQLEEISIVYSNAEVLESAFSDLPNLQRVDIYNNFNLNLSELAFRGAHQLKLITFTDFSRTSLPTGFFNDLSSLEYLSVSHSQFENLSSIDFTGLEKVKYLVLNMNRISNISGNSFDRVMNVKYLRLDDNRLENIAPMTFAKLQNLIFLNLEGNQIRELNDGAFGGLANLRSLKLYNNYINSIGAGTFSTMKNLKKLDLRNNRLTSLDEHTFRGLDSLQYLSLPRNLLSTISVNAFATLPKLVQLDLSIQHGSLESIDLNAFPQFIDLQTKSVIQTRLGAEPDAFEAAELMWIKDTRSLTDYELSFYQMQYFGSFKLNENGFPETNLNDLSSQNVSVDSLIFGNLDLSGNIITSVNLVKN